MASEQNEGSTSVPFSETKLCVNNCGFWGNSTTMDLCSKCYKDFCLKEERAATAKAAVKTSLKANPEAYSLPEVKVESSSSALTFDAVAAAAAAAAPTFSPPALDQPVPVKKANRCGGCNKKVGLTGFKCKCGVTFCGDHRYPESHDCTFDFKGAGRDAIEKANPVVKADKVERF